MGWNEGYAIMERTVVSAYNTGTLSAELLRTILAPYRGTDIDHGGSNDLITHDGKTADDVILLILSPKEYQSLCETKAALKKDGINGESIHGLGDIPKGAKRHQLYGGAEVIRDRRVACGFRVTRTPEWERGYERLADYEDAYLDALVAVTDWH